MTEDDEITDAEEFHAALVDLLAAAQAGGVPADAMVGMLTSYLTQLRGQVRLPLSMPPDRAREFTDRVRDRVGGTVEVDLYVTDEVVEDLELQLRALEATDEGGENGGSEEP